MEFKNVKMDSIFVKKQVRTLGLDKESLKSLSDSIAERGILQPIIVRRIEDDYIIIAGERRFLASQLAGLKEIPSLIVDGIDNITEIQLIENIQREDLNPLDLANSFQKLRDEGKTLDDISLIIGKSLPYVKEILTILKLTEEEKEKIKQGEAYTNFTRKKSDKSDESKKDLTAKNSGLCNENNNLNDNTMTENNSYSVAVTLSHIDTPENQEPLTIDGDNMTENNTAVLPAEPNTEDQKLPEIPKTEIKAGDVQNGLQSDPYEAAKSEEVFETETDYPDYSELPKTENTDEAGNVIDTVFAEPDSLVNEDGAQVDIKNRPVYETEEEGAVVIITPEDLTDLIEKFNSENFGFKIKILKNKTLQLTDITTLTAHGILVCLANNVKDYLNV